jgi:prepilin-type N-terminal cleavage/methylation domain-containing protein
MRRRAFTLVEVMTASLIMAVSLVALFRLWTVCDIRIQQSGEISECGQIARAELERAKLYGSDNFPTGTYNSGAGYGTWTGSFDPTANSGAGAWTAGHLEYFDLQGNRLASSTTAGVRYSLSLSTQDSNVQQGSGTSYFVSSTSRRALIATVRRLPDDTVLYSIGTNLVKGGL